MTGAEIKRTREELGLIVIAFAEILGVHPSTLYRWEATPRGQVGMCPLQGQILLALDNHLKAMRPRKRLDFGGLIKGALLGNGPLSALALLLKEVTRS